MSNAGVHIADWLARNDISGGPSLTAERLVADSRQVVPGAVFVALRGQRSDGARFAADAVARGAVAVLCETPVEVSAPAIVVPDLRQRLAALASSFYGNPSADMRIVGVTGTNGKTTTTHILDGILQTDSHTTGLIGTVGYKIGAQWVTAPNTTPDSVALQTLLFDMKQAGVETVSMEVSSHALAEGRVDGIDFDVGVFTNISRDHLDYHLDMETYFAAKATFFRKLLPASRKNVRAVVNIDDPMGPSIVEGLKVPVWTVGMTEADFHVENFRLYPSHFAAEVRSPYGRRHLESRLPGRHNVYNAVQAMAAALALGIDLSVVERGLREVAGVAGRLEYITGAGRHVYVDYAHTDDALRNVIEALRPFARKRLITVFGCGGDRDRGKRSRMGRVAAEGSDMVVVTSDNPRSEDPLAIIGEITPGVEAGGMGAFDGSRGYVVEADRREAIRLALRTAESGDFVLVAGKGHEDYQIIGDRRLRFDDREEVRKALAMLEGAS